MQRVEPFGKKLKGADVFLELDVSEDHGVVGEGGERPWHVKPVKLGRKCHLKGWRKHSRKLGCPLKNRPKLPFLRKGSWIPAAMVVSGSVNLKTSTTQVSKYHDKTTWWRANFCRCFFPISLLNFQSSLASPQMVLGVELLVIFSCDSFPSLLVIPFDREDWYDWNPQAMPFTPGGVCGWITSARRDKKNANLPGTFRDHLGDVSFKMHCLGW